MKGKISIVLLAISVSIAPAAAQAPEETNEIIEGVTDLVVRVATPEEKAELKKKVEEELAVKTLKGLGDKAYQAGQFGKSLRYYRKAYYASMLVAPEQNDSPDESEKFVQNLKERLAENEMLLANYSIATELYKELGKDSRELALKAEQVLGEISFSTGDLDAAQQHADAAITIAREKGSDDLNARLLKAQLESCRTSSPEGEKRFSEIIDAADRLGAQGKHIKMRALMKLAALCRARIALSRAETHLRAAIKIAEETYGEDSLEYAACLAQLAGIVQRTDPELGKEMLLKAASTQVSHLGTWFHPAIAKTYLVLASNSSLSDGEYELVCRSALSAVEGKLSDRSPLKISILRQYRVACSRNLKNLPALELSERQLDAARNTYGEESLQYATALMDRSVALVWNDFYRSIVLDLRKKPMSKSIEDGAKTASQAAGIVERIAGSDSLLFVACLETLSWIQKSCGQESESIATNKRALEICSRNSDSLGVSTLKQPLQDALRDAYVKEMNWDLASKCSLAPALVARIRENGLVSREFSDLTREVDTIRSELEKSTPIEEEATSDEDLEGIPPLPKSAKRCSLGESLSLKIRQVLPVDSSGLLPAMNMLRSHYGGPNLGGKSLTFREEEKAINDELLLRVKEHGSDSPYSVSAIVRLGKLYRAHKEFSASKRCLERAERIIEDALGSDHPRMLDVLPEYVKLLVAMGDTAAAKLKEAQFDAIYTKYGIDKPSRE